ncbi:transposase, partial [Nostoc sp. NZL]|uniref:transposase n=1 Tax=Nostoc sp. NZL TaxID=2650612 RepID=UPI0018C5AA7F|nr:transposase [Nostoc sp. NZL]
YKNDLLNLSIREWICLSCQTTHDRDENASRNLRAEGIRILALSEVVGAASRREGLSTNTAGHAEIQACGEAVRLVGTCANKRVSKKQESPTTA